jgi:hypothetical protein
MAGDRIALIDGASPQDAVGALLGPIGLQFVRWKRKWDKKNRSSSVFCRGIELPKI